ncbi:UNVERIFIED_CONTAM: microtubule-associated protein AIR9 [Sesamum angustifolium]|uniref:Microtubule-associated protein AIR9 n=1 Tax=Sesamum angustifolium TaxID=2727405 RepID=A0AAW2PDZ0_9LAMI
MEVSMVQSSEDPAEMHRNTEPQQSDTRDSVTQLHALQLEEKPSVEGVKKAGKVLKPNATTTPKSTGTVGASKRKIEAKSGGDSSSNEARPTLTKPTMSSASRTSGSVPATRRSSTGGLPEKQPIMITKRQSTDVGLAAGKRTSSLASDPLRKSLPEIRRTSALSIAKPAIRQSVPETRKSVPISPVAKTPRTPTSSDSSKQDSSKKTSLRSSQLSVSSVKKISSPSLDSTGSSGSIRKSITKVNSLSARSPTVSSGSKSGSVSTSLDRSSTLPGRKKVGTPESRDSRLIMLPQVEAKAGDDVIVPLGFGLNVARTKSGLWIHLLSNIKLVRAGMLWLSIICYYVKMQSVKGSSNFYFCSFFPLNEEIGSPGPQDTQSHQQWAELVTKSRGPTLLPKVISDAKALCFFFVFVYLRDNLLSTLDGIEVLKRVKVLDLSFNDFKGPGFEPLENCKALQQLYLAGNQITSLKSLPELPNLEFLSVAQNKLKSLSMASQPRLQVLAASKNKISTLKGFPCLPALEHLRVEENPILKMSHLEAASILLVGPTLKKFNDRDLSREEIAIAKRYPSHTALCIRGGWELCRPEQAVDSTFKFLLEQWKEQLPSGYLLKHASVDQPFEEDACCCRFEFVRDVTEDSGSALDLKYQWFIGDQTPSNFTAISGACKEIYFPKNDDIGRILKVECTPILGDTEYPTFLQYLLQFLQVMKIDVRGELVEGNTIKGYVEVAWCGGTPAKGVASWLRRRWNSSPVVIAGAEEEEYQLMLDDIDSCLVYMYTPVTEEGAKGEPQYAITDYVKAGPPTCQSLEFHGSLVEGAHLSFIDSYSGGLKGDCLYEWFRVKGNGLREKLHVGEFLDLTFNEVGECVELVYTPVRADGMKGSPKTLVSHPVAPGDPLGVELVIPDCSEGQEVVPEKRYFGGQEGAGKYIWFRTKNKLHEPALMELANNCENVDIRGQTITYTPSVEDVGTYLALYWVPTRSDGKCGKPLVSICESPVIPAVPEVSNVCVKKLSSSTYYGEGEYFGGYEGASLFSWYRQSDDGTVLLIEGANSKTYEVTDEDYNYRLLFGYTPVRSDSVVGELRLSEPSDIILPELPRIEMLALTGKAVEGEVLTALEVIPKSENQQLVWGQYNKEVKYQWFFSSETENEKSFELFPSQRSCSYKVRFEDIGRYLRCECIVTDVFGRSSEPAYAETSSVLPGVPRMDKLEIEGRGFHTNLYAVRGVYSGGKEGKSRIQWLRSMVGSPDLISIPGETGRMYEANVDDVGYRLVAIYTPVRDDGVEGQPVSASTDPIAVVLKMFAKLIFEVVPVQALCDKDRSAKRVPGMGSLERRILEVNRKRVKVVKPGSKTSFPTTEIRGSYAPPFHVELFRNDQHRLRIVVDSENEVDLMVQTRHLRDVIVLVIRGLAQRFNSTSLNTLLKIEA